MTNTNNTTTETTERKPTYCVHARLGDQFEDIYVYARTAREAIREARKQLKGTALDSPWTNFVV